MKCLSLKQPFADLLASGRKKIELRTWNTRFRGPFLIHASGTVDREACSALGIEPEKLVRKAVVGRAVLYGVKKYVDSKEFMADQGLHMATENYSKSRYGFLVRDAVRLKRPIPLSGRLGFFEANLFKANVN